MTAFPLWPIGWRPNRADTLWPVAFGVSGPPKATFSLAGWYEDLGAFVSYAAELVSGGAVSLVGFGSGGALALCLASADARVGGVASFGSPATFSDWAQDVDGMLEFARRVGVVRRPEFPPDISAWAEAFTTFRPDEAAKSLSHRPVLIVHGADDDEVPVPMPVSWPTQWGGAPSSGSSVAPAIGCRADPRAIALLVGWLERQGP